MLCIISIIFVLVILEALMYERKRCKAPSSPLMLVVVSNIGVLVLYLLTQKWLGFHAITFKTVFILLYGCFIFAMVSLFFNSNRRKVFVQRELWNMPDMPNRLLVITSLLTIAYMFLKISAIGMNNVIDDEDAQEQLGGGGLSGHVLVIQIFLLTHLLGLKFSYKNLLLIIGLFICLLLYQVKVWILAPVFVGIFLHRDLRGAKFKLWQLALIPVIVFAIFVGTYSLSLGWDMGNMEFLWAHFCGYVFAGIGGLNEAVLQHLPEGLTPLYGLPSFITIPFSLKIVINDAFGILYINDLTNSWSNVFSLFGSCWYLNGFFVGSIYMLVIAGVSYYLYNIRIRSTNYWYYLAYYMWSIGLILSFYGNYYTLLSVYELTLWAILVGYFSKRKKTNLKSQGVIN